MEKGYSPVRRWLRKERAHDFPRLLDYYGAERRLPVVMVCDHDGILVEDDGHLTTHRRWYAQDVLGGREPFPAA